jgi:hypothetical protein
MKRLPPVKITEADVMKDTDQVLSAYHIFHWRNNTGVTRIGRRFVRFGYPGSTNTMISTKTRTGYEHNRD